MENNSEPQSIDYSKALKIPLKRGRKKSIQLDENGNPIEKHPYINTFLNSSVVSTFVTVSWGSFVGVLGPIYWLCVDWIISTA
jgi:hypothetical protein